MASDELDELYGAKPEDFTALRTELASAAMSDDKWDYWCGTGALEESAA